MDILFPHENIRPVQKEMMDDVANALKEKKNLLAHAPTGLGKTASTLSVAVPFAIKHNLTVFFLTNRHTQHNIAVETLRGMRNKHSQDFTVADIVGKKWMCAQDSVTDLYNQEFMEYCKALREGDKCSFYSELYKIGSAGLSAKGSKAKAEIRQRGVLNVAEVKKHCISDGVCPYYLSTELARGARVIIADYNNIFNPEVQKSFFARSGKELEKSIIIVDEGHNLADRIRDMMSSRLTSFIIKSALQEAKKFNFPNAVGWLNGIQETLISMCKGKKERLVSREEFIEGVESFMGYDAIVESLEVMGSQVRAQQKRSFLGSISEFLEVWDNESENFARIIEERDTGVVLHNVCLDAAELAQPVYDSVYASITMSGTLTPTSMFGDILGINRRVERSYPSPFPPENRRVLVVPETTTKYSLRGDFMYGQIADVCAKIANGVPGNSAFFFPSYDLMGAVYMRMGGKLNKALLVERPVMKAEDKTAMLTDFKLRKDRGAVLFAVAAANFSEGIDLPGDYLKAVTIVGLPLAKPDLLTRSLIAYYERKFSKGWEYGYIFPAMTKCLQAAGRCIRSETDRGVIIFLDQRFIQPEYYSYIPADWQAAVTRKFEDEIKGFFGVNG